MTVQTTLTFAENQPLDTIKAALRVVGAAVDTLPPDESEHRDKLAKMRDDLLGIHDALVRAAERRRQGSALHTVDRG